VQAVVLVGGFGTRLRPLTNDTPKQMLPVVDRPMIEWVLGHLARYGVDEAVLALGYRPEPFLDRYGDGVCAGVRLVYAVEDEPLDTAGAVAFAARRAGIEERFLVLNGDVLTDVDVGALVATHEAAGAEGTLYLTPVDDPSRYGVVPTDDTGRIEAFVEKPPPGEAPTNWINAGMYVLEPSVLDRIPAGRRVSIERETFPAVVADRALYAHRSDAYWIDTGTPRTYIEAQLDLVAERRTSVAAPPAVAADAHCSGATVTDSVLMAGVRVDATAEVVRSVLLPGSHVAAGATVTDSVVGPGAAVGENAAVTDFSIVGGACEVPAGTILSGARVPDPEG
jgi:mannose-1-phosphate guanylyltransferase